MSRRRIAIPRKKAVTPPLHCLRIEVGLNFIFVSMSPPPATDPLLSRLSCFFSLFPSLSLHMLHLTMHSLNYGQSKAIIHLFCVRCSFPASKVCATLCALSPSTLTLLSMTGALFNQVRLFVFIITLKLLMKRDDKQRLPFASACVSPLHLHLPLCLSVAGEFESLRSHPLDEMVRTAPRTRHSG